MNHFLVEIVTSLLKQGKFSDSGISQILSFLHFRKSKVTKEYLYTIRDDYKSQKT